MVGLSFHESVVGIRVCDICLDQIFVISLNTSMTLM